MGTSKTINKCRIAVFIFAFMASITTKCIAAERDIELTVSLDASLIYNDSVGNDWDNIYYISYDGSRHYMDDGESVTFDYRTGDPITIYTEITEEDTYPDSYSYTSDRSFDSSICESTATVTHWVIVEENNGRYTGNTAKWEMAFEFSSDSPSDADLWRRRYGTGTSDADSDDEPQRSEEAEEWIRKYGGYTRYVEGKKERETVNTDENTPNMEIISASQSTPSISTTTQPYPVFATSVPTIPPDIYKSANLNTALLVALLCTSVLILISIIIFSVKHFYKSKK